MMNPDAPTILFVREVPWQTHFPITTRVLAGDFAADGWNVVWLTPPLMPWHRRYGGLYDQHRDGGIWYGENVFAYTPRSPVPVSRRFPLDRAFLIRWMWSACRPAVLRVLQEAGIPAPDLLFIAHWSAGEVRHYFPATPVIVHVTDNYAHYPAVPAATCERMQRENYRSAGHIIVTAPSLKRLLRSRFGVPEAKISLVTHGIDPAAYDRALSDPLPDVPRPRAMLLGNTRKLDFPLLAGLADALPSVAFVVIGPPCAPLRAIARDRPNVYIIGAVMPEDVPAYLVHGDVGLVLLGEGFRAAGADMSPMKLFEYAAAGLPLLGQPLPVYDALNVPFIAFESVDAGRAAIRRALAGHTAWSNSARAFAMRHTQAQKYTAVRDIALSLLHPAVNDVRRERVP